MFHSSTSGARARASHESRMSFRFLIRSRGSQLTAHIIQDEALSRLPEELRPLLLNVSKLNESCKSGRRARHYPTDIYAVTDEDWKAIKDAKKFPEAFKPLIHTMGQKAVELGLIGDTLYDVLPFVIRYNRFTMKASPILPQRFGHADSRCRNTCSTS